MKKKNIFLTLIMVVSMLLFTDTVFAVQEEAKCSAMQLRELREIAANLKVTYVPKSVVVDIDPDLSTGATSYTAKYLDIKVYNMSSRIYLDVKNDAGFSTVATASNLISDGTLTFRQEVISEKVNYEFVVKTTENGCANEELRTIRLSIPIYNSYSQLDICKDIPDYYLCQEFITTPVDGATFYDRVDAYKAKLLEQGNKKEDEDNTGIVDRTFNNVSKYKYLIVGVIVALGVVITIVIIKRKENV